MDKNYEVLNELVPKTQELHRAIFDKGYEQGKKEIRDETGEWILVSERLPEEREWVGTKRFGTTVSDEVYVTFEEPNGERFTKHLMFHNGKLSRAKQNEIDAFHKGAVPVAWMPLPEPYKGSEG